MFAAVATARPGLIPNAIVKASVNRTAFSIWTRRQPFRFKGKLANTLYSCVLLVMIYDWPNQVYQKLGPRMPEVSMREQFIVRQTMALADRLDLRIKPTFVMGSAPASAGAFSGNAVIVVSPEILNESHFGDDEVRFILAHEIGHIARLDAYRFWSRWTQHAAENRELDADRIAVLLVGCDAMTVTVTRHWNEFLKGFTDDHDHHPHPAARLAHACRTFARESRKVSPIT